MKKITTLLVMALTLASAPAVAQTADSTVAKPVVEVTQGTQLSTMVWAGPLQLTVTCATPGTKIYYLTKTGLITTVPNTTSTLYEGPITVPNGTFATTRYYRFIAVKITPTDTIWSTPVSTVYKVAKEVKTFAEVIASTTANGWYAYTGGNAAVEVSVRASTAGRYALWDGTAGLIINGSKDKSPAMAKGVLVKKPFTFTRANKINNYACSPYATMNANDVPMTPEDTTVELPDPIYFNAAKVAARTNVGEIVVLPGVYLPTNKKAVGNAWLQKDTTSTTSFTIRNALGTVSSTAMAKVTSDSIRYNLYGLVNFSTATRNKSEIYPIDVTPYLKGDVNIDSVVNVTDVTYAVSHLLKLPATPFDFVNADTDENNKIDTSDVTGIVGIVLDGQEKK